MHNVKNNMLELPVIKKYLKYHLGKIRSRISMLGSNVCHDETALLAHWVPKSWFTFSSENSGVYTHTEHGAFTIRTVQLILS